MAGPKNKKRSNTPSYLPTPEEIQKRKEIGRWMLDMGWPDEIMDSVMQHDSPSTDAVRRLVYRHGPVRALRIIRKMCAPFEGIDDN